MPLLIMSFIFVLCAQIQFPIRNSEGSTRPWHWPVDQLRIDGYLTEIGHFSEERGTLIWGEDSCGVTKCMAPPLKSPHKYRRPNHPPPTPKQCKHVKVAIREANKVWHLSPPPIVQIRAVSEKLAWKHTLKGHSCCKNRGKQCKSERRLPVQGQNEVPGVLQRRLKSHRIIKIYKNKNKNKTTTLSALISAESVSVMFLLTRVKQQMRSLSF